MSEYFNNQENKATEQNPAQRHRRSRPSAEQPSTAQSPAAFSRVSGPVNPASGESRVSTAAEDSRVYTPSGERTRRPVSAPGYTRREPARASTVGEERVRSVAPVSDNVAERGRIWPRVVILVVLLLVLIVLGLMIIPDQGGVIGAVKHTVTDPINRLLGRQPQSTAVPSGEIIDLNANPTQGTAPMIVTFSVTTRGVVDDIGFVQADGTALEDFTLIQRQDNTDVVVWVFQSNFSQAFSGDLSVTIKTQDEWRTAGRSVNLQIAAPAVETISFTDTVEESGVLEVPALPQISGFAVDVSEGEVPLTVHFTLNTESPAEDIRMIGSGGERYPITELSRGADGDMVHWEGSMVFDHPVDDIMTVELLWQGEWVDTFQEQSIYAYEADQSSEAVVTIAPTEIPPVPTQAQLVVSGDGIVAVTPSPAEDMPLAEEPVDEQADDTVAQTADSAEPVVSVTFAEAIASPAAEDAYAAFTQDQAASEQAENPGESEQPAAETVAQKAEDTASQPETQAQPEEETPEILARRLNVLADASASPTLIKNLQRYNTNNKKTAEYVRDAKDSVDIPSADEYNAKAFGILTFRGSAFRQNAAYGTVSAPLTGMQIKWQAEAGSVKGTGKTVFYGIGRNSQAAIVRWAKNVREFTNMEEEKRGTQSLKEVIIGGEDGKIYFLDLADGEPTRKAINLGYPMRSAPSLDPNGNAFMVIGQYARKMASGTGKIGLRYYNLLNQKEIGMIDGTDGKLKRPISELSSFDTTPIIDRNSKTMISAGSNGLLYVTKLNIVESYTEASLKIDPSTVTLRTQANGEAKNRTAVSASMAGYQNYVFYADRGGILRCVDVNSLSVLWAVETGDAVEAAVALDLDEEENLWLYTATTLQNRNKGDAVMRCYNAETGALRWELPVNVTKTKSGNPIAGVYASPVVGTGMLKNDVFFTVSAVSANGGQTLFGESGAKDAALVCIDKVTGKVKWAYALDSYAYSSPVAVYGKDDCGAWILQASANGTLYMLDAQDGTLVSTLQLEGSVLGSPAVYNSTLVIGSQGKGTNYIYGISLE